MNRVFPHVPKPLKKSSAQLAKQAKEAEDELNHLLVMEAPLARRRRVIRYCGDMYVKGWKCPKCNHEWCQTSGARICYCDLIPYSHYHLHCLGTYDPGKYNERKVGCRSWMIMLSADVPNDYDPREIVVPEKVEAEKESS